jgi:hypothetical protein
VTELSTRLGEKALVEVGTTVKPEMLLTWPWKLIKLITKNFDGST